MNCHLLISPQMFSGVQVWASSGCLKDVRRLVPKPHQHCLSCMHWVVVMVKGEIFPHSEDVCTLEQFFFFLSSTSLSLAKFILLSVLTCLQDPHIEKHGYNILLLLLLQCRDGISQPKSSTCLFRCSTLSSAPKR